MDVLRVVDAFCASCDDVHPHAVMTDDPSSCFCNQCGTCQTLVKPIDTPGAATAMERLMQRRRGDRPGRGEIWFSDRTPNAAARQIVQESGPHRQDIWSADRILAGMELLVEAMAYQRDIDVLHDLGRVLSKCIQGVRRRGQTSDAPALPSIAPAAMPA